MSNHQVTSNGCLLVGATLNILSFHKYCSTTTQIIYNHSKHLQPFLAIYTYIYVLKNNFKKSELCGGWLTVFHPDTQNKVQVDHFDCYLQLFLSFTTIINHLYNVGAA